MSTSIRRAIFMPAVFLFVLLIAGCGNHNQANQQVQAAQSLPVTTVQMADANDTLQYAASIQGIANVEIRPQVSGYLSRILTEEGAFVKAGQTLFEIDDRPYQQQLANAQAALKSEEANLLSAKLEVDKQQPLVENKVVAPINLKTAQAAYEAAQANVAQAKAAVQSAQINLNFCRIQSPVSGYVGSIPHKRGSLVSSQDAAALTTVSDIHNVYAYFSMGEDGYLNFQNKYAGNSISEKIKHTPAVLLQLSNGDLYRDSGRIQLVEGQFDANTASIQFRAIFPNAGSLLRTGNTGTILIPEHTNNAVLVPIASTTDLQDKVFVWRVDEQNKVHQAILTVKGKSGVYYIISDGIKSGDKIVESGFDRLSEGAAIVPSVSKAK
ncbi:hypothetical protein A9P82_09310 [Arachidicoccus ginsenosidimutans]|uniref:efflux RND transporter periplasmic adaptor subunit n=1 Tax=Arachidicoccus sp. BS20 TaxID=1850526 RepID=UPI0007F0821C|nr:efflux RND transporter periplasmic adaptor subunit [Arachidicoccus sp. BS20]ANI89472.1 hypothetical protein A9P82_09310 [Arachidicoccus sp. BS20]